MQTRKVNWSNGSEFNTRQLPPKFKGRKEYFQWLCRKEENPTYRSDFVLGMLAAEIISRKIEEINNRICDIPDDQKSVENILREIYLNESERARPKINSFT